MKRILLAEDDNDMRRFLVKALEKAGYHVTHFDNGASAYDRLREEPFSLLLTDIVMPEMDGIELARRASEIDPDPDKENSQIGRDETDMAFIGQQVSEQKIRVVELERQMELINGLP